MRQPHNALLMRKLGERFPNLSSADISRMSGMIFNMIMKSVTDGQRVEIRGFGVFSLGVMEKRLMRNPGSGEMMEVAARKRPRFRAGNRLRTSVNHGAL